MICIRVIVKTRGGHSCCDADAHIYTLSPEIKGWCIFFHKLLKLSDQSPPDAQAPLFPQSFAAAQRY